jgi:hypothetical protein
MTASERADLAESLVPVAAELAFLVRDEGREAIGEWMDDRGLLVGARITEATRAFLVVLAAMVRADATQEELLEWITWDEDGRPLDGTAPLFPALPVASDEDDCPSMKAWKRHRRAGATNEELERCGCAQAARDYRNARYAAQKAKAAAGSGQERSEEEAA